MKDNYYAGILNFKAAIQRLFPHGDNRYDWADLAPWERKKHAEREATPRERRSEPRD